MAALGLANAVWGFALRTDDSGVYVIKWNSSPVVMQVKLPSTANLIDGNSQRSTVAAAMQAWNAQLGTVQLSPVLSSPGAYSAGNGTNEIVMDSKMDDDAFPTGVLAITLLYTRGDDASEADIIFNTAYTWDSYRSLLRRGREDLQRVAIHELGHVLGLLHPDESGQYVTAIMNSRESDLDRLWTDDIAGGQKLYGAPGFVPANNDFGGAGAISLSEGSVQVSGENMSATRESGEPSHAGSSATHSVWWKWTAAGNSNVAASTLGSNFDTVLAVYAGASLPALTPVASNDDEETPEQNSTPQRKRTSKVTFSATGGTTYYFAVDGWGSARTVLSGYTGSIALNLDCTRVEPPVFTSQPANATVMSGEVPQFGVNVTGRPPPALRWQRRAAGGAAWLDLSEGGGYEGTLGYWLRVTATLTMDGDQLRCVATNAAGTTTSEAAVLHVAPIPVPVITAQPQGDTLYTGIAATLQVGATGAKSYQWYRGTTALNGQTDSTLIFADPQPGDAGEYHVVVSNDGGSTTSSTVTLKVVVLPVVTNLGAARQTIGAGQTLSLKVSATGAGTLAYQWYRDGRPVAGATAATYTRLVKGPSDAGAYWAAVTDGVGTRQGAPFFAVYDRGATNVVGWGLNGGDYGSLTTVPAGLTTAAAIAADIQVAVAVKLDGTVQIWGDDVGSTAQLLGGWRDIVGVGVGRFAVVGLKADGTVVGLANVAKVPVGLNSVWAVAASQSYALGLKTDGTVVAWSDTHSEPAVPAGLDHVVGLSAGRGYVIAVKADGSVVAWNAKGPVPLPPNLSDVVAVSAGVRHTLALRSDGTVTAWFSLFGVDGVVTGLSEVVAISAGPFHSLALKADGTVVAWAETDLDSNVAPAGLGGVFAVCAGGYTSFALRSAGPSQPLLVTTQPQGQEMPLGGQAKFISAAASGDNSPVTYQWQLNGKDLPAATSPVFSTGGDPTTCGLYSVLVRSGTRTVSSQPAILGLAYYDKLCGTAAEVGSDILHPVGNIYDQVLLQGKAATIRADDGQVTRMSFIDLDDDIVQIELSGPGSLTLVLDGATGPATPLNYHQPSVSYMKGHAGIVIAGASERTHVSVFSVGRATAFDPTGSYNILAAPSPANNPARNGSPLFAGHEGTVYDGVAGFAFIAISSNDGKFGGVRTANAHYFAAAGLTGLYAPGVQFTGPVYLGDITAFGAATPAIVLGAALGETRITGGDLFQENGQPVQVKGLTTLKFTAGQDSHGRDFPAQSNRGVLQQDGADVTAQIVVNPTP